jgi:hypothetical protein
MDLEIEVDDELLVRAREVAALQGKSLEELVVRYVTTLANSQTSPDIVQRLEENWRSADEHFRQNPIPKDYKFNREEIYAERLDRIGQDKK